MISRTSRRVNTPAVLVLAPLPPPYAGPEIFTEMLLNSPLRKEYRLIHVSSNLHGNNKDKGRIGLRVLARFGQVCARSICKIATERPQIIYTLLSQNRSGFLRDVVVFLMAKSLRKTIVWHFTGDAHFQRFYMDSGVVLRWLIRLVCTRSEAIIVVGPSIAKAFQQLDFPTRTHIVPNAIEVDHISESFTALAGGRAKRGHQTKILYLGVVSQAKGVLDLLRAAEYVLARATDTKFLFAGELIRVERNILRDNRGVSLDRDRIESVLESMQSRFPENIIYLGSVSPERKWQLLAEVDVLVHASYSDSLPLSILEAMAAGLPVIATPVGAIPDFLREGVNVRFVRPGDFEALARCLLELIDNPQERYRLGATNYEYVRRSFAPEVSAAWLASVFNSVVRKEPRSSS